MNPFNGIIRENDISCFMMRNLRNNRLLVLTAILVLGLFTLITPVTAGSSWFHLTSNPSGAWFCIDGYKCEYTPRTWAVDAYSSHTITMYKDGYQTWSDYVGSGSDGSTVAVDAELVPDAPSNGWLKINSFGADITIDGIYHGNGADTISLSPGTHTILLQKAGFNDLEKQFTITAGKTTNEAWGMTESAVYGTLQIESNPKGAAVYVDDNYKGSAISVIRVHQLTPGTYTVLLTLPDYEPYTKTADVRAGIIHDIRADMVPVTPGPTPDTTGQINVGSSPEGAAIWLDNGYKGITPMVLADIPQGSHSITLKMDGYQDWISTVKVDGGNYAQVSGTLSPDQQPTPTLIPPPTKTPVCPATIISALGICGAVLLVKKRE